VRWLILEEVMMMKAGLVEPRKIQLHRADLLVEKDQEFFNLGALEKRMYKVTLGHNQTKDESSKDYRYESFTALKKVSQLPQLRHNSNS
jgi:hypothetical protein